MKATFFSAIMLILIFSTPGSIQAQESLQKQLPGQLAKWQQEMPEEKVYLHLDKNIYLTGEVILARLYLVDASLHQPSYISTVAYVELINTQDSVIIRKILEVKAGGGSGSLAIPQTLASGTYRLRSYTQWMRNTGAMFQTSIQLINPDRPEPMAPSRQRISRDVDLQFLPEGGQWVAGLESQVGVKALGPDGLSIEVSGEILDEDGRVVGSFATVHKGMGKFVLQPQKDQSYRARVKVPGKTEAMMVDLPEVQNSGFGMRVQPGAMFNEIQLSASRNLREPEFILLAQVRGQIVSLIRAKLKDNQYSLSIPNYKIPAGIMQITLFDQTGIPQCERLVFIRADEELKLDISHAKTRFQNREAVELNIKATDPKGEAVAGNFSLSVSDIAAYWDSPDRSHLLSHLWLSSDLQGFVEEPNYYFSGKGEAVDQNLDLLMLTQGWRKYDWQAILNEQFPEPQHLIEQGLMLRGSLRTAIGNTPKTAIVNLLADNLFNTYSTQAIDGEFAFTGLEYSDTSQLVFQALTPKNREKYFEVTIDSFPKPPVQLYPHFEMEIEDELETATYVTQMKQQLAAEEAREGELIISMEEVEITGRREEERQEVSEGNFYREPSFSLPGANQPENYNVFDAIRGQVPGVKVSGSPGNYSVIMRGINALGGSSSPLFLLDGNVVDASVLEAIFMYQVERIDVLQGAAAGGYGMRGGSGVIAVHTKEGYEPRGDTEERLGILKTRLPGFHYAKTFYSPNYAVENPNHTLPDLRTTLYWNPMVQTNEKGEATVRFFTGDTDGAFLITLEGISPLGLLGRQTDQIEVLE